MKTSDVSVTSFQCTGKSCPLSIQTQDDDFGYTCHITVEHIATDPEQEKNTDSQGEDSHLNVYF